MGDRLALLVVLCAFLLGCGGAPKQAAESAHRVLDMVTVIADPIIGATTQLCEDLVVDTDQIQDDAAAEARIDQIEAVCDPAIETFHHVADAQKRAREALEAVERGDMPAREAAQVVLRVQEAYEAAKRAAENVERLK